MAYSDGGNLEGEMVELANDLQTVGRTGRDGSGQGMHLRSGTQGHFWQKEAHRLAEARNY